MKFQTLLSVAVFAILPFYVFSILTDRKILVSKFVGKQTKSETELEHSRAQFKAKTFANLKTLPSAVKTDLLHQAETALKGHYPERTATAFMDFFKSGRLSYDDILFGHRRRIVHLFVGHLLELEHDPKSVKYLNELVNGVWMLLESSTWCAPEHLYWQGVSDQHLPLPDHNAIDLNVGKEIQLLGWLKLMIGEQFDHISTVINKRIDYELKRRVFQDYLLRDYGWGGFVGDHVVNNWDMMNNANILKAALFTLNDILPFNQVLNKTLYSVDYFLDKFGEDGASDEGPGYWKVGAARLIEYLDALEMIFGEEAKKYFTNTGLIRRIVSYSYNMRIVNNWFVNFADSVPVNNFPPQVIAKYGAMFSDETLKHYASYLLQFVQSKNHSYYIETSNDQETVNEFFNFVELHAQIESYKPEAPEPALAWMPDLGVMTARLNKDVNDKLFVATKAGHNHESHNHNDVGNFILYQNGHPVLIDIGVGGYTAQTFSAHRYDLFYMQSQYHNTPTINGVQQKAGAQFTSHNTSLKVYPNDEGGIFSTDIAAAYPTTSHTKHWIRSINFNRTSNIIELDDQFVLEKFVAPQQLHFVLSSKVKVEQTNEGALIHEDNLVNMKMQFDSSVFDFKVENHSLDGDHKLTQFWGDHVQRITLTSKADHKQLSGHFTVKFVPNKAG